MTVLERLLESSHAYELSRRAIGAHREMSLLCERVISPKSTDRVLDFGCGNGRLVPFLPNVHYIGVDSNPSYIAAARSKYTATNVEFVCGDLFDLASFEIVPIDVVVCVGVLHHLDDETARRGLRSARALLRPGGRLVTMDPCFEPSQHSIARVLMALDRGRYVRHPSDYRRLVDSSFDDVDQMIWSDVYRFPYTHCIMTATVPGG